MDVAAWLKDLKLERYVSAFRDNDIDAEVSLLNLTLFPPEPFARPLRDAGTFD